MTGRNRPDSIRSLNSFDHRLVVPREAEQNGVAGQHGRDKRQERVLAARAQVGRQEHPVRLQQPPAPAERTLSHRVEHHVIGLLVLGEVLDVTVDDSFGPQRRTSRDARCRIRAVT